MSGTTQITYIKSDVEKLVECAKSKGRAETIKLYKKIISEKDLFKYEAAALKMAFQKAIKDIKVSD